MKPRYQALWEAALRWWDMKMGAVRQIAGEDNRQNMTFELDEVRDNALIGLQANYRIGKVEVGMLGLFDEQVEIAICDVLVDWATFTELAKKKV